MRAARYGDRRAVHVAALTAVIVAVGAAFLWQPGWGLYGTRDALRDCSQAIIRKTTHPDVAKVPQVDVRQSPTHYYVRWHLANRLHLQNAFEVMVEVTGECVVSRQTQRIVTLYVDGESWAQ